jgi:hypothetical protein
VRANFSALATPAGRTVADQLQTIVPQFFFQRPNKPCKDSEHQGTRVDASHWDGEKLTIDGAVSCEPIGGLPPETISKVLDSVKDQPHDAAVRGLEQLKHDGLIGDYQLPDQAQFPRFDWLITVQTAEAAPARTQPTQSQPTQGAQP